MTISMERPLFDDGQAVTELPAPAPSQRVAMEDGDDVRAVVTARVALSRDHLAAAADLSAQDSGYPNPDTWSVDYTRFLVEVSLAHCTMLDLSQDAEALQKLLDEEGPDTSVLRVVQAVYRAVDRAYPPQPAAVRVFGGAERRSVACIGCSWTAVAVDAEEVVGDALEHFERAHRSAVK
ncbi:hypothetical protein ACIREE_11510 [Streptomyces sp. NPDC102467]|uniref:hypothetical protein n=1 Tax=Streptomyces sp. NPDC102467 TaxID=3366179 RepID=UPI003814AF5F